jgi:hypothetical protein
LLDILETILNIGNNMPEKKKNTNIVKKITPPASSKIPAIDPNKLTGKSDFTTLTGIETLDDFFAKTQNIGSIDKALSNNLYGINHQAIKPMIMNNRDSMGLTFFTRPQLNLSTSNIRNVRTMYSLLSDNRKSIHMYVRNMLDPRLYHYNDLVGSKYKNMSPASKAVTGFNLSKQHLVDKGANSEFIDNELAFIPIFTNTIKNMSGWPDVVAPTFTSKAGVRGQQWSIVDGYTDVYDAFDLDCTFRNVRDEPIVLMLETWVKYMSNVFEGMMSPYLDHIAENVIDYNTRIYRLVLDESKRFVKKISATGASFPLNVPTGRMFDFSDTVNYNDQNNDINVRFKCNGAMYNDDILIEEFNQTSAIFNDSVRKYLAKDTNHTLITIPYALLPLFNNRGYPIIDTKTLELTWLVDTSKSTYINIKAYLDKQIKDTK